MQPQPASANNVHTASAPLLAVRGLRVAFRQPRGVDIPVVRGVDFDIHAGECVALVGESGCGKSITCMALTGLPPTDQAERAGTVLFADADLLRLSGAGLRRMRRGGIAYVFQDPVNSLNPVMRIAEHLAECHTAADRPPDRQTRLSLLESVGLPARALQAYPGELSGGQLQRVMIAMALAAAPRLLIADEPTTALDVRTQRQVLDLLGTQCAAAGIGRLLVTHNLGLAAAYADTLLVMYAGRIVERGPVGAVLRRAWHPYTDGLLRAVPRLDAAHPPPVDIPGTVPHPASLADFHGCPFAPRCERAQPHCRAEQPPETPGPQGRTVCCWHPLV